MTTTRIDAAEVANIVRGLLKEHFPATKFSVKTSRYSGGSSITVGWMNGPTKNAVEAIAGDFHGASFDGMIDLKDYHESEYNGEQVRFGNDYISFERHFSDEHIEAAINWYLSSYSDPSPVKFIPTSRDGKWVTLGYPATSDWNAQRIIMDHLYQANF